MHIPFLFRDFSWKKSTHIWLYVKKYILFRDTTGPPNLSTDVRQSSIVLLTSWRIARMRYWRSEKSEHMFIFQHAYSWAVQATIDDRGVCLSIRAFRRFVNTTCPSHALCFLLRRTLRIYSCSRYLTAFSFIVTSPSFFLIFRYFAPFFLFKSHNQPFLRLLVLSQKKKKCA